MHTSFRSTLLLALTLPLVSCSTTTSEISGDLTQVRGVDIEGESRSYIAFSPNGVVPQGAPVILVFHGAGGNAESFLIGTDVYRLAQAMNAVLAIPDANHANWAEDCQCVNADVVHGVADTAMVSTILQDLKTSWRVDAGKVYAVGFSQGGMFAQRLACQMSGRLLGVAVIAATMSVPLAERCDPASPISVFMALSMDDPIFPWTGADKGAMSTLGGVGAATEWQMNNACDETPEESGDDRGTRWVYSGCASGVRVELLGIPQGNHAWGMSADVDTSLEVARFFGG